MLFGAAGMALSMTVLAIVTSIGGSGPGVVAAVFLFVFNTFFAIGWLGMTWLYPSEIVPLAIRAPSSALSTSANWIFNFMVVMITPVAFAKIGYRTYIIFAVINAVIVPCVYFFYPETAYRSLEEMDEIFRQVEGWKGAFDVVRVARPDVTPNRYDKHGNLLVNYLDTEEHRRHNGIRTDGLTARKAGNEAFEDKERSSHNEGYHVEGGFASGSDSGNEKTIR